MPIEDEILSQSTVFSAITSERDVVYPFPVSEKGGREEWRGNMDGFQKLHQQQQCLNK